MAVSSFGTGPALRRLALALAILASYGAGCGDDDPPPPTDAGTPTLEIGTGEADFTPVVDGGTVEMHVGCQGLQHVWVALRTRALSPTRNIVEIQAVRLRDGFVTSMPFTARLSFVASGDSASLAGLPMVIEDPSAVLGEEIEIRSTVRDMSGAYAMATKRVMIVWGTPICGGGSDIDAGAVLGADGG